MGFSGGSEIVGSISGPLSRLTISVVGAIVDELKPAAEEIGRAL
ncbi:MAG TPA: hypothetical protein VN442_17090 [Bryobacteraceae bacterium]|nr:hypothetical protein [Bryobacteraceae bacterium]